MSKEDKNSTANHKKRISHLAEKWLNNSLTDKEEVEFNSWYDSFKDHEITAYSPQELKALEVSLYEKIKNRNRKTIVHKSPRNYRKLLSYAAVFTFFALSFGLYLHFSSGNSTTLISDSLRTKDIVPGSKSAFLTLADGRTIELSKEKGGVIVIEDEIKYSDGTGVTLVEQFFNQEYRENARASSYNLNGVSSSEASTSVMLALSTPNGGQYQITLSDGTKVWLNAASSLTYPSRFTGKNRRVELVGEAYFEVAENKKMPFIVKTVHQEVKVLGTDFNINAYVDEQLVKTTLVSGKIQVHHDGRYRDVQPGQQTAVNKADFQIENVNVLRYTSWKNGVFYFEEEQIEAVVNKIARWYGVEFEFIGEKTKDLFTGKVASNQSLSEVLRTLEVTEKVNFKINEDGKIMVRK